MSLRFAARRPAHRLCIIVVLLGGTLHCNDVGADVYRLTGELIPGTEEITLGPGVHLDRRELEFANLQRVDLSGAHFELSNLTNASLSGSTLLDANLARSNLTNANLSGAVLTDANLTGVELVGASITSVTGFTEEQLYSTASYQAKNLQNMGFRSNDFTGWNLAGQNLFKANLARVNFSDANLSGANLVRANLHGARFPGADLIGANLSNSNLASARFAGVDLTGANIAGAIVPFRAVHGFTRETLYSTASYKSQDLEGIVFSGVNVAGWDFSGQNLATASFRRSTLTEANFAGANLINANLFGVGGLDTAVFDSETIYSRWTVFPDDFDPVKAGITLIESTPGDFNGDGTLDAIDVDLLSLITRLSRERDGPLEEYWVISKLNWLGRGLFDLDASGRLDNGDRHTWVRDLKRTWSGDANFDGEFSSDDLDLVFRTGHYEDFIKDNSGWAEGDWNGDGEFDSADLVVAFQDDGYGRGPRIAGKAVPEPTSLAAYVAGLIALAIVSNCRRKHV